jgi:hypothetical protein
MKFKDYIKEESTKKDTIVVLNGRMNPMTRGHEENINGMTGFAKKHNADHLVIASHSQDNKKNPLAPAQKLKHLQRAFPAVNIKTSDKQHPTIFHQLSNIHDQGYKHVVLASGADRTEDYDRIKEYNGKHGKHGFYNFKSISTASTGERTEGISGTDMRNHAVNNNFKEFKKNLPTKLAANTEHAKEVFDDVKTGLQPKKKVTEDYENPYRFDWGTPGGTKYMQNITPNKPTECVTPGETWSQEKGMCVSIREAYINDEIFKLNEVVETTNGDIGPIVFRGSTYVTMKLENGQTVKHWLKDIVEHTGKPFSSKISEPVITYKKRFSEQKAALLMSKEALSEMLSTQKEITYQDYKTTNLHMCADASKQLKELMANSKLNPKFVLQAIQATDQYLGIEKAAMKNGYADQETVHNFIMKFAIAHDTLNMLGYPDKDLAYMEKHLTIMSNLSMHKDTNFANEIGSTINTYGAEDTSEGVDTSDYAIKIEAQGNNRKVHPARIITDKQVVKENRTMKPNYSNFRKKIQEIYEPDPPTHNRDINFSDIKDVFHGIDNPIHDETIDGKPVGLISFKTFMNEPMNKKLAVAHEKDRQDVHRDQLEFSSTRSPSYKMMKKVNQLEP